MSNHASMKLLWLKHSAERIAWIVGSPNECNFAISSISDFSNLPFNLVEKHTPGSYEKVRLRFAHAETVVPFTCLLGLFLERSGEDLNMHT